MTQQVRIQIKGEHRYSDSSGEPVMIPQTFSGIYRVVAGRRHILYREAADDGSAGIRTDLILDDSGVEVHRRGAVCTDLFYHPGELTDFVYTTGYGSFDLKIRTNSVQIEEKENELTSEVRYELLSGEDVQAVCRMTVTVQPE